METNRKPLTAMQIKAAAAAAMALDHFARLFLPGITLPGLLLHLLGRITAPVMCFFLAEGYLHTRSVKRYAARLALCALASAVPYSYLSSGTPFNDPFSMAWTLFFCLLALTAADRVGNTVLAPVLVIAAVLCTAVGDWALIAPAFCLSALKLGEDRNRLLRVYAVIIVCVACGEFSSELAGGSLLSAAWAGGMNLGSLLCLPLLARYGGERGGTAHGGRFFYFFYPLHLLALDLLAFLPQRIL